MITNPRACTATRPYQARSPTQRTLTELDGALAIRSDGLPHAKSPDFLGNANQWTGASSSSAPHVGDIAQWDPNVNGAGSAGHVAYVAAVNSDSTITVDEYNWLDSYDNYTGHALSIRTIPASAPSRYLRF